MITFITVVYVLVCVFLILVVLLQAGRGGGMGAAMGGSTQTVFGGAGAGNFLQRLTVISASLFMILSATLAYLSSSGEQALERADERVRAREEARTVETKSKGDKAAAAAVVDAGLSTLPELTAPGLLQEKPAAEEAAGAANAAEGALPAAEEAAQEALAEEAPSALPAPAAEPAPAAPAPKGRTKRAPAKTAKVNQAQEAAEPAVAAPPAPEPAPAEAAPTAQ